MQNGIAVVLVTYTSIHVEVIVVTEFAEKEILFEEGEKRKARRNALKKGRGFVQREIVGNGR